jgi:hypothetical protein
MNKKYLLDKILQNEKDVAGAEKTKQMYAKYGARLFGLFANIINEEERILGRPLNKLETILAQSAIATGFEMGLEIGRTETVDETKSN